MVCEFCPQASLVNNGESYQYRPPRHEKRTIVTVRLTPFSPIGGGVSAVGSPTFAPRGSGFTVGELAKKHCDSNELQQKGNSRMLDVATNR